MKYNELLLRAVGDIDEKYIFEAARPRSTARLITRIGAIAASLFITVGIAIGILIGLGESISFDGVSGGGNMSGGGNGSMAPGTNDAVLPSISSEIGRVHLTYVYSRYGVVVKFTSYGTEEDISVLLISGEEDAEGGVAPTLYLGEEKIDALPKNAGEYFIYIEFPEGGSYSELYFSGIGTIPLD